MSWGSGLGLPTTDLGLRLPLPSSGGPTDRWQYALACGCRVSLHHHQPTHVGASNNTLQQCVLVQCLVAMQGGAGLQIWVWV